MRKHPIYLDYTLDPQMLSNKHIECLVEKRRERLDILKYIAEKDWGGDAKTLWITYPSLIKSILEYGSQIQCCSLSSNVLKFNRLQLSATHIITSMRNSCPSVVVLYEYYLQSSNLGRNTILLKYLKIIYSYRDPNRTSAFIRSL